MNDSSPSPALRPQRQNSECRLKSGVLSSQTRLTALPLPSCVLRASDVSLNFRFIISKVGMVIVSSSGLVEGLNGSVRVNRSAPCLARGPFQ